MANYHTSFQSPMSVEEAFDYLADFSNASEWDENTVSSDRVNDGPLAVGDQYRVVTRFAGRELTLAYETVELDRPNRVALESASGLAKIRDTMTFESSGAGCEVTYDANIEMKSIAKLLDPAFKLIFNRVGDRAAESLKEKLNAK